MEFEEFLFGFTEIKRLMELYYGLMLKLGLVAAALFVPIACADATDSADAGFTVRVAIGIAAPPQEVYTRLVHNVGDWWSPAHTFSGNSHFLTIDDRPMGCFCERRLNGTGGVRHMEVLNVDYGKTLVLPGALGPLQSMAVTGSMTIQLTPQRRWDQSLGRLRGGSYQPHGMTSLAPIVDSVLTEQFGRLKRFVETGKAEDEKAAPK